MLVKQRLYTKILMVVGFALAAVLLLALNSSAVQQSDAETANTLKVTPVRSDISADPGQTETVQVTVSNPADFDVMVQPIQNDFIAGDEDGTPALVLDEDEYAPTQSLKRFMQPLENVTIPAGEAKTIDVVIKVPADAQAGGYFGAVRFAPVDPDGGGQVNMSASVASLILLRVNGDVPEKLNMTEFEIQQDGNTGAFFLDDNDLAATVRFENEGGVQLAPFGKISITKGDQVVGEIDFNDKQQRDMILPDSARRWSIPLTDVDGFGKYTVNAVFSYGSTNQTIEVSKSFWVIPVAFWIAGAVVLLLLVAAIIGFIYSRRRNARGMSLGSKRR